MKFEIGDTVSIIQTGELGVIISINIKKNIGEVEINGIKIPIHLDAVDHPYLDMFIHKKYASKPIPKKYIDDVKPEKLEEKNKTFALEELGIYLVFVPVYNTNNFELDNIEKAKVYFVNNTTYPFSFHYHFYNNAGESFSINSEVNMQSNFYLHNVAYEQLATGPYFEISGTQQIVKVEQKLIQFNQEFQLRPKKLYQFLQDMRTKNNALFKFTLLQLEKENPSFPIRETIKVAKTILSKEAQIGNSTVKPTLELNQQIEKLKNQGIKGNVTHKSKNLESSNNLLSHFEDPFVIDLHIEKLVHTSTDIAHNEKLTIQLQFFLKALDNAIYNRQDSLTVIHGLGKGVLKAEIHGILNQTKEVHSYVNEYTKNYGYGSTQIFFTH
jgi:dsDNA-specific endonuclease/ATPase MutS2